MSPPDTFEPLGARYLEYLRTRAYAETTIDLKRKALQMFATWCIERGMEKPVDLTRDQLERFQHYLAAYRQESGSALNIGTQYQRLVTVRNFYRWMVRRGLALHNPASELELPKLPRRLPRDVLTESEAEAVIAQPDVSNVYGLRDRAMLEVLYSTGMRRVELIHLDVRDVDFERCTLVIHQGKGGRDRVVPLGERPALWVRKYLDEARPTLHLISDEHALFITHNGERMHRHTASMIVKRHLEAAGIAKEGCCHLLRHTAATVMIEHGADIRYVQELLGHAKLETTQIYTHVAIARLKEVHAATHPGASLKPLQVPKK